MKHCCTRIFIAMHNSHAKHHVIMQPLLIVKRGPTCFDHKGTHSPVQAKNCSTAISQTLPSVLDGVRLHAIIDNIYDCMYSGVTRPHSTLRETSGRWHWMPAPGSAYRSQCSIQSHATCHTISGPPGLSMAE